MTVTARAIGHADTGAPRLLLAVSENTEVPFCLHAYSVFPLTLLGNCAVLEKKSHTQKSQSRHHPHRRRRLSDLGI